MTWAATGVVGSKNRAIRSARDRCQFASERGGEVVEDEGNAPYTRSETARDTPARVAAFGAGIALTLWAGC